jgi:hypothetical protein
MQKSVELASKLNFCVRSVDRQRDPFLQHRRVASSPHTWFLNTKVVKSVQIFYFLLPMFSTSGCLVHRAHRVATAAFWRTLHHDGKISPGWWGWGVHAHPPPFAIFTITYKVAVYVRSSWEGRNTHPISSLSIYCICTLWSCQWDDPTTSICACWALPTVMRGKKYRSLKMLQLYVHNGYMYMNL